MSRNSRKRHQERKKRKVAKERQHASSGESSDDRRHRLYMLDWNREKAEAAYVNAVRKGIAEPVVWVMDANDKLAADLLVRLGVDVESHCQMMRARGLIPSIVMPMDRESSLKITGALNLGAHTVLQLNPINTYQVIVVASGGCLCHASPLPDMDLVS